MTDHKRIYNNNDVKEWIYLLEELKQKNILLNVRLSDAIRHSVSRSFIEEAELFQQKFIKKDQMTVLLLHDVVNLSQIFQSSANLKEITLIQQHFQLLDKDLKRFSSEFEQMEDLFDAWIVCQSEPE